MNAWERLGAAWSPEPAVFGGCALLLGLYLGLARPLTARAMAFIAGLLVIALSLMSPLHILADDYLFGAHMLQHMLLALVAPPLLLLGLPRRFAWGGRPQRVGAGLAPALAPSRGADGWGRGHGQALPLQTRMAGLPRAARLLTAPAVAWAGFHLVMSGWHWPPLYEATLRHDGLHRAGHLLLLATATLFWLPTLAPAAGWPGRPGLAPWATLLYLGAAIVAGTLLGIVLTFAPPLYPSYLSPPDTLGILPMLRDGWDLTPAADQQIGGLLMWIPGGLVYSFVMLLALARWLEEPDEAPTPPRPAVERL